MSLRRRSILGSLLGAPAAAGAGPSLNLTARLLAALNRLEIVSTHEHLLPEPERLAQKADFFALAGHYLVNDLVTAGLDPKTLKDGAAFEKAWRPARFTGYAEALRIALRDIYGIAEINARALPRIDDAMAARNKPGLYRYILKDKARLRYGVLDDYWHGEPQRPDPEFFVLARKFDWFVAPGAPADLRRMEEVTQVSVTTLAGLKRALERRVEQSVAAGMVTIKTTLAYQRPLLFHEVPESDAERDFERLARGEAAPPAGPRRFTERPLRALEDHMFHHLLRLAHDRRLPVQVHTGIQAGNGNFLPNSNPALLNNLLLLYPRVSFDLFHIGYPYVGEIIALAKMFPNVYVDFCWAHILSPAAARRALDELLDAIPFSKILGFGGDYRFVELSYAHARIARANIAHTLAQRVESRWCTETEALEIARALLSENPARLFPPPGTA